MAQNEHARRPTVQPLCAGTAEHPHGNRLKQSVLCLNVTSVRNHHGNHGWIATFRFASVTDGTNYFAPSTCFTFFPGAVLESNIYVIAGPLEEARAVIYSLRHQETGRSPFTPRTWRRTTIAKANGAPSWLPFRTSCSG